MTAATTRRSHPERSALAAFVLGTTVDDPGVADHLRDGCLSCLLSAKELVALRQRDEKRSPRARRRANEGGSTPSELEKSILRLERKAILVAAEGRVARELVAELMLKPGSARRDAVRESRRYQLLAVSEFLRDESREETSRDLARALDLAELSAEVADCLDTGFYGSRVVADVRALSWATVGNGQRVAGDFFAAERAFQAALGFLDVGSGSPTEHAEISGLLASLRAEQSRFQEAVKLLGQAASTYRALELSHEEGRVLVQMGRVSSLSGNPTHALHFYQDALELLDPERDRWLRFLSHHNIAFCLNEAGASEEAHSYLTDISPLYEEHADDTAMQLRRRWLEGRISAGRRHYREATRSLMEVRSWFMEHERAFETAQVTLDMATVFLEMGDIQEVKRLAKEMYPVFRSQDVHREAIAALLLFERAAAAETATVALTQDIARYLTRARNNPYLRYEPEIELDD